MQIPQMPACVRSFQCLLRHNKTTQEQCESEAAEALFAQSATQQARRTLVMMLVDVPAATQDIAPCF